jgi:hypothetical protein
MHVPRFFLILSFTLLSLQTHAEVLSCKSIFGKEYDIQEFVIDIPGKKQSNFYLKTAHENLVTNANLIELKNILMSIRESGLADITPEQRIIINKFRQDTSFLRSVFQTSSKDHASPEKFGKFVRDFGHLKDMVNMDAGVLAQTAAKKLLKQFVDVDFAKLLTNVEPASRKSVKKYFKAIIKDTQEIMKKQMMTVDELHDVRKNMRDILRFMQIQQELKVNTEVKLTNDKSDADNEQIDFLKKLNKKLGEDCDAFATQIISGEISKFTVVEFPEKLRGRVEWFLERYRFAD